MECHRSLGVATLVALMATHRALSAPLTSNTRRPGGIAASPSVTLGRQDAAPGEPPRRPAPARPTAKAPV
ncbi:hypothetical protein GCM10011504_37500 [Siccirubricoccus deserti]|nr:hypothetical protein GCM10011504_37500 [Siccirubricoccus deserti]